MDLQRSLEKPSSASFVMRTTSPPHLEAPAGPSTATSLEEFHVGDPVEVFSNSCQAWCPGEVMEMLGAGELRIEFAHGSTLRRKITRRPYQDVRRLTSRSVDVSKTGDLQEKKRRGRLLELMTGPFIWTRAYEELVPTTFADQKGRFTHVVARQTSCTREAS